MKEPKLYADHPRQRRALHLWCDQVAEVLNAHGLDMKVVLKEHVQIPWAGKGIKQFMYKPLLEAMTGHESTEKQTTVDPDQIVDYLCKHLGEKFGIELPPWPDRFSR